MLDLFYSEKKKAYFCTNKLDCTNCKNKLNDVFLMVYFWDKKESWYSHYCKNCFEKFKNHSTIANYFLVFPMKPPKDAISVYPNPPIVRSHNDISVYDIAKIDAYFKPLNTKDKSVYAGRESLEGAQIGNLDYIKDKRKQIPQELMGEKNERTKRIANS